MKEKIILKSAGTKSVRENVDKKVSIKEDQLKRYLEKMKKKIDVVCAECGGE